MRMLVVSPTAHRTGIGRALAAECINRARRDGASVYCVDWGGEVPQVVDISTCDRYQWGAASEGWHLLNRPDLSVIQERVPAGDRERRHFHAAARQFFYVLQGEAVLELGGSRFSLGSGQGLEVPPGVPHRFSNEFSEDVIFLVVSAPHAHGDRTELA